MDISKEIEWYQSILCKDPCSKEFFSLAECLVKKDFFSEAIVVLEKGLFYYPQWVEARLLLVELLVKENREFDAREQVKEISLMLQKYDSFWSCWGRIEENNKHLELSAILLAMRCFFEKTENSIDWSKIIQEGFLQLLHEKNNSLCLAKINSESDLKSKDTLIKKRNSQKTKILTKQNAAFIDRSAEEFIVQADDEKQNLQSKNKIVLSENIELNHSEKSYEESELSTEKKEQYDEEQENSCAELDSNELASDVFSILSEDDSLIQEDRDDVDKIDESDKKNLEVTGEIKPEPDVKNRDELQAKSDIVETEAEGFDSYVQTKEKSTKKKKEKIGHSALLVDSTKDKKKKSRNIKDEYDSSLRTKTMADLLAMQKEYAGALDIYTELYHGAKTPEDRSVLLGCIKNVQIKQKEKEIFFSQKKNVLRASQNEQIIAMLKRVATRLDKRVTELKNSRGIS